MKIVNLKPDEYEKLLKDNNLDNFYQSIAYGNLMSKFGFKATYLGFVHNGLLVGA